MSRFGEPRQNRRQATKNRSGSLPLALTIGANTAVLSIADAVLFRPLLYKDPDRLFVIWRLDTRTGMTAAGVPYTHIHLPPLYAIPEQDARLMLLVRVRDRQLAVVIIATGGTRCMGARRASHVDPVIVLRAE